MGDPPSDRLSLIKNILRRSNIMCTLHVSKAYSIEVDNIYSLQPKPSDKTHFVRLLKEEEKAKSE